MKSEDKIRDKFGVSTGYTAPEGFLTHIYGKVDSLKGEYPQVVPERVSIWLRVRPYLYLAAMFAGIWCMMKMFTMMTERADRISLDNPPAMIAKALQQPSVVEEMDYNDDMVAAASSDYELEQAMQNNYDSFEQFEADFDYTFKEEYADLQIP